MTAIQKIRHHCFNADFAISLVLMISVTAVSILAIVGVLDGWPRLELALYGPKPV